MLATRKGAAGRPRLPRPQPETEATLDDREIMTASEVADYLNCHYSTVYWLIHKGGLPAKLGGDWRVRRSDLEKWIAKRHVRLAGSGPKARQQKAAAKKQARKGRSRK
jgi:excisionase family DNA binding protein